MSETTRASDARRERTSDSGNKMLDMVTAGMAAAGIGLTLLDDRANAVTREIRSFDARPDMSTPEQHHTPLPETAPHAAHEAPPSTDTILPAHAVDDAPVPAMQAAEARTPTGESGHDTPTVDSANESFVAPASDVTSASPVQSNGSGSSNGASHGVSNLEMSHAADSLTQSIAHVADTLHTAADGLTQSVQQIGTTIHDSVTGAIDSVTGAIDQAVTAIDIPGNLSELPATLLGGAADAAHVDSVFANAFQPPHVPDVHEAGLASALTPVMDFASFADDTVSSLSLGLIGQSYTEHADPGGHSPNGMLHGLV